MSKKFFIIALSLILIGIVFLPSTAFAGKMLCIDCKTNSQATGPDANHTGRGGAIISSRQTTRQRVFVMDTDQKTCPEFLAALKAQMEGAGWVVGPVQQEGNKSLICIDRDLEGHHPTGGGMGWEDGGLQDASVELRKIPGQPHPPNPPIKIIIIIQTPKGGYIIIIIKFETDEVRIEIPTYAGEPPDSVNNRIRNALESRGIEYTEGIGCYPIHPEFDDSLVCLPSFIIWKDSLGRRPDGLAHTVTDPGISVSGVTTVPIEDDIPTLTEWGLIIFGLVLLGFITWVFLRRRKAEAVSVVES
jgi:cbb3-type cytochrome oxidase subunit 3